MSATNRETSGTASSVMRETAEKQYAAELTALAKVDDRDRPPRWNLSPWAVVTYLMGGKLKDGTEISAKYVGDKRIIEIAVATLATDRALLLLGVPGTAKSWVSEHLAAAISGDSASSSTMRAASASSAWPALARTASSAGCSS